LGSPRSGGSGSPSAKSRLSSVSSRTQSPGSSRTQSPAEKPGIVRQGTFTKDDPSPKSKEDSFVRSKYGIARQTSNIPARQASSASLKGFNMSSNQRTPPKIPPKPSMFRRDTVSPSPNAPKPIVATTKTQQLREKSLTRGGLRGSNSSTSSIASKGSSISRTSIRTSSSSHSLRTAANPGGLAGGTASESIQKRTPSSSEIERRRTGSNSTVRRPLSPIANKSRNRPISPSTRPVTPKLTSPCPDKAPKKDVASKIASLWKKVEDTKKKEDNKKKKDSTKDKRIWISKGRVQDKNNVSVGQNTDNLGSNARLIRSGTYEKLTDPNIEDTKLGGENTSTTDGNINAENKVRSRSRLSIKLSSRFGLKKRSAAAGTAEDHMNGNTPVTPDADDLGNSVELLTPDDSTASTPRDDATTTNDEDGSMSSPRDESVDTLMGPPPTLPGYKLQQNKAKVRRNSSYVSSLGRKMEEGSVSSSEDVTQSKSFSKTSSSVVTLV